VTGGGRVKDKGLKNRKISYAEGDTSMSIGWGLGERNGKDPLLIFTLALLVKKLGQPPKIDLLLKKKKGSGREEEFGRSANLFSWMGREGERKTVY